MILITTAGRCAVELPEGGTILCTAGDIIAGTPECEAFLISRGAAERAEPEQAEPEEAEPETAELPDYGKMTVAQLKNLLKEKGIDIPDKAKKDELIRLLEESEGV